MSRLYTATPIPASKGELVSQVLGAASALISGLVLLMAVAAAF